MGLGGAGEDADADADADTGPGEAVTEVLILDARSEIVFDFWVPWNQKWAHPFVNFFGLDTSRRPYSAETDLERLYLCLETTVFHKESQIVPR